MKKRDPRPYVGMHKEVIFGCPEWAALSAQARDLYWLLKGKRNPNKNDGKIKLPYREIKKIGYKGLKNFVTISRCFKELENSGWIERDREGGGLFRKANLYTLSGRLDEYGMKWSPKK